MLKVDIDIKNGKKTVEAHEMLEVLTKEIALLIGEIG